MEITISDITRRDIPSYIEFLRAGFGGELGELGTDLDRFGRILRFLLLGGGTPLKLVKRITGHEAFALIARHGERPIGCLTVVGHGIPSLTGVYVISEFRGRGVASRLIEEAVERLRRAGYAEAHASPLNATAQHLVEKVGFTPYTFTTVYEHTLPLELPVESGFILRRTRRSDLIRAQQRKWRGRPYKLRFLGRPFGIRVRKLTVIGPDGPAACAVFFTMRKERVGEVRLFVLTPAEERALIPLLKEAEDWFRRLRKETIYLFIGEGNERFNALASELGFRIKRKWTYLTLDLQKKRGG